MEDVALGLPHLGDARYQTHVMNSDLTFANGLFISTSVDEACTTSTAPTLVIVSSVAIAIVPSVAIASHTV